MLAYGLAGDQCDEYVRIGESTAMECLQKFCRYVIEIYSDVYLGMPNEQDIQRYPIKHGLPRMLGSTDCMHWYWKNCPVAWKGQYARDDHGGPTIMLEAVESYDLWIWHAYFGVAGSNNGVNVINQSSVFNEVLEGMAPPCNSTVNGNEYTTGYYLTYGIYPEWSTLVKSFTYPQNKKMLDFKDEGGAITDWSNDEDEPPEPPFHGPTSDFQAYIEWFKDLRNNEAHHALRNDLMEHL
ncbi:uncharacterized protein LOC143583968 [Bidens hawaiensis]|uniref:uncharacterized protein LOC143583968 n=1 Tax=Bidens hawaiensis TaxID=980011 RepID=UPI00404ADC67